MVDNSPTYSSKYTGLGLSLQFKSVIFPLSFKIFHHGFRTHFLFGFVKYPSSLFPYTLTITLYHKTLGYWMNDRNHFINIILPFLSSIFCFGDKNWLMNHLGIVLKI